MNPANPPAIFMGAPELLHVATALAALEALEIAFRLENIETDDFCNDPEPSVAQAAAILRSTQHLRGQLHQYRRLLKRLLRPRLPDF